MSNLTHILTRLKENKEQIAEVEKRLQELYADKRNLTQHLQEKCSHPSEYLSKRRTNQYSDPLEADHFVEKCEACGKILESYSLILGKKYHDKNNDY